VRGAEITRRGGGKERKKLTQTLTHSLTHALKLFYSLSRSLASHSAAKADIDQLIAEGAVLLIKNSSTRSTQIFAAPGRLDGTAPREPMLASVLERWCEIKTPSRPNLHAELARLKSPIASPGSDKVLGKSKKRKSKKAQERIIKNRTNKHLD
jgi:hypothetical protein